MVLREGVCEFCLSACTSNTFLFLLLALHGCSFLRYSFSFTLSSVIIWPSCMHCSFQVDKTLVCER